MANTRRALITGVTGQDGSYLAEFLIAKGYEVHGLARRNSNSCEVSSRIDHLIQANGTDPPRLALHFGDLTDGAALGRVLHHVRPTEVYNLAAQSDVRLSFDLPVYTSEVDALGTLRILEAIRDYQESTSETIRFFQASSSEMFGLAAETPQRETTPFHPRSPYGVSKVYSHWITVNYRESYGIHASSGILFNHESPRRGTSFVTRKITRAACRIKLGLQDCLFLGNLDAIRDWGYAPEYVETMWLMLQQKQPNDYVIATGVGTSVREFCNLAFGKLGLDYREYVRVDPRCLRPAEVDILIGDARKAQSCLGWTARTGIDELVATMIHADCEALSPRDKRALEGHVLFD